MRLKALFLFMAIVATVIAPAIAETFNSGPIKFRFASDGGSGGNAWIVADGEITADTPKMFRQFLVSEQIKPGSRYEVYLNSPGGNFLGGLELGEIIREFGFGTRIARSVSLGIPLVNFGQAEHDGPGACYSACAFAFLGGSWRIAAERSLGVHQHYLEEALAQPNTKKFTAID